MADLIIVCRNKRQAKDLYDRTCSYLCQFNHPRIHKRDKLYVEDTVFGDSARFVTMYEIKHKHIDDGLRGVRLDGDFFDKWLDERQDLLPVCEAFANHIKNYIIDGYLHMH